MANAYHRGKRVSVSHGAMLSAYEHVHGAISINQGRRTLAEQWGFWNHYRKYGSPLAAYPSPAAPHIKWGREHHAMDVNAPQPAHGLADFYRSHGVPIAFNVRGEPWHMDTLNENALKAAARKLGDVLPTLRYHSSGKYVVTLKKLLYDHGVRNFSGKNSSNRYIPFFGKYTKEAVMRFQSKHGLKADGIVGTSTWKALH
jgi:hypothetical protein